MHFWIDKRSQCAYGGRHRVPSSLSSGVGVGRGRGRYGAGGRKGMAAPVHRFAALDCPPRRPHRSHSHSRQNGQPPAPAVHSIRRQTDSPSLYVEIPPSPAQPTIASLAAARSVTPDTLIRTAALGLHHHSPMMAPHLKFGMLVSFALATLFLAGAKLYFDKQMVRDNSGGSEASVVCAAVACVCGVGCALSMCRAKPTPLSTPEYVSSTALRERSMMQPPPPQRESSDDISLTTLLNSRPEQSPEAPPPYHIAVLLPGRSPPPRAPPRDISPPAYSALS